MVRDIMGLMEILSFLYMVAAVYNVKMKYNIYTVVFIVSELFLLSGINNHGFSPYFLGLSYLFSKRSIGGTLVDLPIFLDN